MKLNACKSRPVRTLSCIIISGHLLLLTLGCAEKSNSDIQLPFTSNRWELLTGKYATKPIIIEINRGLEELAGNSALKYQAAVSVSIKQPLKTGLPDRNETDSLKIIENLLVERLVNTGLAVFALQAKCDNTCDFIFYTGNKKAVKGVFSDINQTITGYKVDCSIKADKKWTTYKWFSSWDKK